MSETAILQKKDAGGYEDTSDQTLDGWDIISLLEGPVLTDETSNINHKGGNQSEEHCNKPIRG